MNTENKMGLHVLGELYTKKENLLIDLSSVKEKTTRSIAELGLTRLDEASHVFPGGGYTFVVLLAESHISIHTWPELGYVTIDVFVCNLTEDNSSKARDLFDQVVVFFEPDTIKKQEIKR